MKKSMKGLHSTIALSLLTISVLSCSSPAQKKEKKLPMEPTSNDALQALMTKSQTNLRYLIYGLLNFDRVKLEKSTANLIAISRYLPNVALPQHKAHMQEWEELSQKQHEAVQNIKLSFLDNNPDQASIAFGTLVTTCVDCHKLFRFGAKGKAKVTY